MGVALWLQKVGELLNWPTIPDDDFAPGANESFEDRMLTRVKTDFENARNFLDNVHQEMYEIHRAYHNARHYKSIRKDKKFPVPTIQSDVDQLNADAMDKFYYSGRPATVLAMEGTSEDEADAKQSVMDWQDRVLNIRKLISDCHKDAIKYRFCCAKVDYEEQYRRKWVIEAIQPQTPQLPEGEPGASPGVQPQPSGQPPSDPNASDGSQPQPPTPGPGPAGQPGYDPNDAGATDTQQPDGTELQQLTDPSDPTHQWVLKDVPYFIGATPKRVDPINVYFGPEKKEIDDEYPIMVWEDQPKRYFYSKPYFRNQDDIVAGSQTAGFTESQLNYQKRDNIGLPSTAPTSEGRHEYIEWQGLVDKADLYNYLGKTQAEKATIRKNERCWAICGIVDQKTVVRLDEVPLELNRPNIIIGIIESEEGELAGASLAGKIAPSHYAKEELMGMLLENFKQSVNRMWAINKNSWVNQQEMVNRPGAVYEFNTDDVRKAMSALEPGRIAPDIYQLFDLFTNIGQTAGGMKPFVNGSSDPAVHEVGIADQVTSNATLRITEYMASFEASFIKPLYDLRNQINMNTIDEDFAYQVTGKPGWQKMTPEILRADVDFYCEASSRIRNLNIMVQQLLQLVQVSPLALQAGQPVRIDKILAKIMRTGWNFKEEEVEDMLPWIGLEAKQGINANVLLAENALDALKMARLQMVSAAGQMMGPQPGPNGPTPGGPQPPGNGPKPNPNNGPQPNRQLPQPLNSSAALEAMRARNSTQVGDMAP